MSRKPTQVKRDADASALRKAVQRSDPRALGGKHELPEHENSEKRMFLFYQDEGGMRATGDNNEDLGVIYYLVRPLVLLTVSGVAYSPSAGHHRHPHAVQLCQADRALLEGSQAQQGPSSGPSIFLEPTPLTLRTGQHMISAVPPREYGDRFLAFIKSSIRGNDVSTRPQMFEHEPKRDTDQEKSPVSVMDEKAQRQRDDSRVEMSEKSASAQGKVKVQ